MDKSLQGNREERFAPSFNLKNKIMRVIWSFTWFVFARFTPPPLWAWRRRILIAFGAKVGKGVRVYGSTRIWYPANLIIGDRSMLGRDVNCYNQGLITIGRDVVISWKVTLCSSTHNVEDPLFPLLLRPITIGDNSWIAAEVFVNPGTVVGAGAVLGARAVARGNLEPWGYYRGDPAAFVKPRPEMVKGNGGSA